MARVAQQKKKQLSPQYCFHLKMYFMSRLHNQQQHYQSKDHMKPHAIMLIYAIQIQKHKRNIWTDMQYSMILIQ